MLIFGKKKLLTLFRIHHQRNSITELMLISSTYTKIMGHDFEKEKKWARIDFQPVKRCVSCWSQIIRTLRLELLYFSTLLHFNLPCLLHAFHSSPLFSRQLVNLNGKLWASWFLGYATNLDILSHFGVISRVFLQHQIWTVNYYVKKLVKKSRQSKQTHVFLLSSRQNVN